MKVLIIGGTKFIGKFIVRDCVNLGYEVTLFNRGTSDPDCTFNTIKGDVDSLLEFKDEIQKRKFDVVIHCIAYTEKHAEDLVSIFEDSGTQVIVLSSCDSYEAFQGLNRKIDKGEFPVTEDSSLSSRKYYWSDSSMKGELASKYDKNLMTEILMEEYDKGHLNPTVFRLSFIYGPYDDQYSFRHGAFIQRILDRKKDLIFSDREQCSIMTFGYVENISAAIVHSIGRSNVYGKIYNLGEKKSRTRRRWAELYAELTGWQFDYHVLPEELLRKDSSYRSAPPNHLIISSDLYEKESGFKEPFTLEDSIKRTFDFAKANLKYLTSDVDYEKEHKLLKLYHKKIDEIYEEKI